MEREPLVDTTSEPGKTTAKAKESPNGERTQYHQVSDVIPLGGNVIVEV